MARQVGRRLRSGGAAHLVIERVVLQNMIRAEHVREIQIINGLVPGNLTKALAGEHVGTKSSRHSGNNVDCPRSTPSPKRFIATSPRKSRHEHTMRGVFTQPGSLAE